MLKEDRRAAQNTTPPNPRCSRPLRAGDRVHFDSFGSAQRRLSFSVGRQPDHVLASLKPAILRYNSGGRGDHNSARMYTWSTQPCHHQKLHKNITNTFTSKACM